MEAKIQRRDPKPDILRIEQLVSQVKSGDIKLPKFQRSFVWKKKDILSLLDSIYKGYPIGSILLWLTSERLASERKIAGLSINERDGEYPTNYILDGQQRLSTLCGALYWDGSDVKSQRNIVFDLDRERFIYPDSENKIEYLRLNKILNTLDFIDEVKKFQNSPKSQKYYENATRLLNAIKDYKLAAVTIRDMNLDEVAPIFERINSTGRKLTIVDLMRAATWKGGFDLNDAIGAVKKACKEKDFEGITELHVLRNIAAAAQDGIHREDIDKLRNSSSEELKNAASIIVPAYQLAVDFLTRELPLSSISYLPYALQLTFLVEFFRLCPKPSFQQRNALKKWFWSTSFRRYFASLNTNVIAEDLKDIRAFALGEKDILKDFDKISYTDFVRESFVLNKATSLSFALLLAQKQPKSLLDGSATNIHRALAQVNRHEFHHIFPKAYLGSSGVSTKKINQHANICLLSSSNNKAISDARPSLYFNQIISTLGSDSLEVLRSNYISEEALNCALEEDYEGFTHLRMEALISEMQILTGQE